MDETDGLEQERAWWPNDLGRTERGELNPLGRMVRRRWMPCLNCRHWFFSRDTVNDRLCTGCGGSQGSLGLRNQPKAPIAPPPPPPEPVAVPPQRKSHGRNAGRRVLAEGQEFPTVAAAHRALGIDKGVLGRRLKAEKPGYRYLD